MRAWSVVKYIIGVIVGFVLTAAFLASCYHGDPSWPTDPTRPAPPFYVDPCQSPDPGFSGAPCPINDYAKKKDGGVD